MLTITHRGDALYEMTARGQLTRGDYERVVPELERGADHGPLRLLIRLEDFHGWTPKALLDDLRFDVRHHDDFERVAVVGDSKLEEWGLRLSQPFFSGEMRYFTDESDARRWMGGDGAGRPT